MFRRTQPLPYGVPSGPGSVKCACRAARVSKRLPLNVQLILSRRLSVRTSAGQPIASLTGLPARLSISTRVSIVNFAVFLFTATDTRGRETIRIPAASDCFTLHEKRAMDEGGANVKGGRANWRTSERRLGIGAGKVLSLWAAIAISDSFNLNPAVHSPHGLGYRQFPTAAQLTLLVIAAFFATGYAEGRSGFCPAATAGFRFKHSPAALKPRPRLSTISHIQPVLVHPLVIVGLGGLIFGVQAALTQSHRTHLRHQLFRCRN